MNQRTTEAGETVYVAPDEEEKGSKAPFFVVYRDEGRDERYGYLCSHCDTLNNAMDPMGRLVCNECGNTKNPEEWDAVVG